MVRSTLIDPFFWGWVGNEPEFCGSRAGGCDIGALVWVEHRSAYFVTNNPEISEHLGSSNVVNPKNCPQFHRISGW